MGALILIGSLATTAALVLDARPASAGSEPSLQDQKAEFQSRYRRLLRNEVVLQNNIAKTREDYAKAQRRNYPRGGARQQLLLQADQMEAELATVRQEIETLKLDARRQGVPPGWLYEVEDEEVVPAAPSDSGSDAASDDEADRAGRNPLYLDDEDEDDVP